MKQKSNCGGGRDGGEDPNGMTNIGDQDNSSRDARTHLIMIGD